MEEMQENTIYFALKSNLRHRMDIDLKRNSMRNDDTQRFFLTTAKITAPKHMEC